MNIFRLPFLFILVFGIYEGKAETRQIIPPTMEIKDRSFAIVTDAASWRNCNASIIAYRDMLAGEDLPAYILADAWQHPEEIRKELFRLYRENHLEGAVFIGDIPIPMIRKAQHLTSTFKMDEDKFPMRESSVPSDRFYDDFDLKFDFIGRDEKEELFFYYNLSAASPQHIRCDIYSGRIKPLKRKGLDPYRQIDEYLKKAIAAHSEANPLDRFVSYTGEGTYSNSLTSWQSEQHVLREHFPGVFDKSHKAYFIRYNMWDYPKQEVVRRLQDERTDLMIFHEHGTSACQYLSSTPQYRYMEEQMEQLKLGVRKRLRQLWEAGLDCSREIRKWSDRFKVDTSWWDGYADRESIVEDSLTGVQTKIYLPEVEGIAPNARMVIFEACYNGDFREDDYIAGRYIFSSGRCIAARGYTVNILQDKCPDNLLGLLGLGARIGYWGQYTNLLESHIIGDPTFRFSRPQGQTDCNLWLGRNHTVAFWLNLLESRHTDLQGLALVNLHRLAHPGISDTLKSIYNRSPYHTLRYQCMNLLEEYNDTNFIQVLEKAWKDPYEFIRRIAVDRMGETGRPEFLPYLVRSYMEDYHSARVIFNVERALQLYRWPDVRECAERLAAQTPYIDKAAVMEGLEKTLKSERQYKLAVRLADTTLSDRSKLFEIHYLKNANYHPGISFYLKALEDRNTSPEIRQALVESLAWFKLSIHKDRIISTYTRIMEDKDEDPGIRDAARRAYCNFIEQPQNR